MTILVGAALAAFLAACGGGFERPLVAAVPDTRTARTRAQRRRLPSLALAVF